MSKLDIKKSDKTEVDVERKRIDTFVALKDGSTTGDAELTDIRVGYNSKTYNTAGESVREQVKDIHHKIDQISTEKIHDGFSVYSSSGVPSTAKFDEDNNVIFNFTREYGQFAGLWIWLGDVTDVFDKSYTLVVRNPNSFSVKFDILVTNVRGNWVAPEYANFVDGILVESNKTKRIVVDGSLLKKTEYNNNRNNACVCIRFQNYEFDISRETELVCYVYRNEPTKIMNTVMNAENAENAENAGFVKPKPALLIDRFHKHLVTYRINQKQYFQYIGGKNLPANKGNKLWTYSMITFDIKKYIGNNATIIFECDQDNYLGPNNNFNIVLFAFSNSRTQWGTFSINLNNKFGNYKKRVEIDIDDYYESIKNQEDIYFQITSEISVITPNEDGTFSFPDSDRDIISFNVKIRTGESEVIATSLVGFNQNDYEKKPVKYITCWGDSLTAMGGWTNKLQELSGIPVYNGGTGGESCGEIVARQGANAMVVNNLTIPANTTPVTIASRQTDGGIKTTEGFKVMPLLQGGAHVNPCKIGDILGTLKWTGASYADQTGTWTFTRAEAGKAITIDRPTVLRTDFDMNRNAPYLMIIFIGQNGGYSSIDDLIRQHRIMIEHANAKHFIVLGLSSGSASDRSDYETKMKKEFGRYFISLREYLAYPIRDSANNIVSCYGLADQGLEPGSKEYNGKLYVALDEIATGIVPHQILMDTVHYTEGTRNVIANLIYKRCKELNIF